MPRLLVETPDEPPRTVVLRDGLTVGRSEGVDLLLFDTLVSRQHLRFCLSSGSGWLVIDQQSHHGTYVNGKPVQSHSLNDGDVIQVGHTRLTFLDPIEASVVLKLKDTSAPPPAAEGEAARRLGVFYDVARAIR